MRLVTREGDVSPIEESMRLGPTSSILAALELHAAIWKRWRDGAISEEEREQLLRIVDLSIISAVTLLPLDDEVLSAAKQIVTDHPLRTLDALHVATAIVVERHARRHGSRLRFCTADRRQVDAATVIFGHEHMVFVPPRR